MAEPFDMLMQVQEHDTTIDQLRHRIDTLPEKSQLDAVRGRRNAKAATCAAVLAKIEDLDARQRSIEQQIASAASRRHAIEHRMESGQVSSSRDLQAMDHEVQQLGAWMIDLEEQELLLLEEQEPLDAELVLLRAEQEALHADAARLEVAVADAEGELEAAIAGERAEREARATELPTELLERYEMLRTRLGGIGAARLVVDHCDGCHLTLSSVEIEMIRRLPPDELTSCPECDRILVH